MPVRRPLAYVGVIVLAVTAAFAALHFVTTRREVGPGTLQVSGGWSTEGRTVIEFPPLGRVEAATHGAPLTIDAQVEELDIEALQRLLDDGEPEAELRADVAGAIPPLVRTHALRVLVVAILAGGVAGAVVPHRRVSFVIVGACAAGLAVGGTLAVTWRQFDPGAFSQPTFHGALARAPQIIDAVQRHVDDVDDIRNRVEVLGEQISSLYAVATSPDATLSDRDVRILHVSDIHSNPLGVEIMHDLATQFDVDAVIDTGDLTSFGYPVEAQIGELLAREDHRYLYVPGNHDSEANRAAIARQPNVELLDGTEVDIGGVDILGFADPTFTATNAIEPDAVETAKANASEVVARAVERDEPDVLAVHDRRLARAALGKVPLVIAGHVHEQSAEMVDGTLVLTVGSTGATGLEAFMVEEDRAYEAQILHFRGGRLTVVDYLRLEGLSGSYAIERRIIDS